jgi:hypothetical protein
MPEKPDDDPFHDCELDPDAVLGTRTFHDVLFTDDTETPVNRPGVKPRGFPFRRRALQTHAESQVCP